MNFSFLNNFNLVASWDWIIVLVFLGVALIYGLSMGRNRLVIVMLGVYFSLILTQAIPWKTLSFFGVKTSPASTIQIFLFLALVLGFYFLIPRSAFRSSLKLGGRGRGKWWQVLVLSLLQVGLILSAIISFLPAEVTSALSVATQIVFVGPLARFLWILLPILAIMFLRSHREYAYDE
ncbi:MAG: hypothetical protein AAB724_02455 [Patescibacteria group bacterium]